MSEPSDYETRTGHRAERHERCERVACMVCDLFVCSICGALEGALLPTCPGRQLTFDEHNANYKHYCNDTGPFATDTVGTESATCAEDVGKNVLDVP